MELLHPYENVLGLIMAIFLPKEPNQLLPLIDCTTLLEKTVEQQVLILEFDLHFRSLPLPSFRWTCNKGGNGLLFNV